MSNQEPGNDDRVVEGYLVALSGRAWGVSLGLLFGGGLFLATALLVIQGGENVGAHLGLLRSYLPGYDVSWLGALIGLFWGAVIGYLTGRAICLVYNRLAR